MTLLARKLADTGIADRFDALYVQSPNRWTFPYEVNVGLDFRRPVHVLLPHDALPTAAKAGRSLHALLILNDGRKPEIAGTAEPIAVAQVGTMTAWAVCTGADAERTAVAERGCAGRDR
jgi:hypothetical protein